MPPSCGETRYYPSLFYWIPEQKGGFIDQEVMLQLGIETELLDSPITAKALNGRLLARVERRTVPVRLVLSGNHHESLSLHVIDSPFTPVVLGYPWFQLHNPKIDWRVGGITAWSTYCHSNCLLSVPNSRHVRV